MRLLDVPVDGPPLRDPKDVVDIIGEAFGARPDWIVIPVARLGDGVLDLKTRLLGEMLQKFVNYGFCVAFLGDVSAVIVASKPFADFVRETNRGTQIWFVPDRAALLARLGHA
ncbi:MAG TPA: DUF4180 domain-containing protein [Rhizomicrobium sp.]|jgi:hypothetical protein|nr:DUF4180 domain-containing protein [Rhizomicrobium sp.]